MSFKVGDKVRVTNISLGPASYRELIGRTGVVSFYHPYSYGVHVYINDRAYAFSPEELEYVD